MAVGVFHDAEASADLYVDPDLLSDFAVRRVPETFTRLTFPAGKLPESPKHLVRTAL
jgi:hypothetical protein